MQSFQLLQQLPEELLYDILRRLDKQSLYSLNSTSAWCRRAAVRLIWQNLELVDCSTLHPDEDHVVDVHDDTAIIKKLLLLSSNDWIASCVRTLTHRCHLPPPAIFNELPHISFNSLTLSCDARTIRLVQLASRHMTNVHTLRIVFGHPHLSDALIRCFFDAEKKRDTPVRKLWLENCRLTTGFYQSLTAHSYGLPLKLDFSGLQSVRFRRLPMRASQESRRERGQTHRESVYARGVNSTSLQNGAGGHYMTSIRLLSTEYYAWLDGRGIPLDWTSLDQPDAGRRIYGSELRFDSGIYDRLATDVEISDDIRYSGSGKSWYDMQLMSFPEDWHRDRSNRGVLIAPTALQKELARTPWQSSAQVSMNLLRCVSATLTSLTLDWILTKPQVESQGDPEYDRFVGMFIDLFNLRFPNLKAFQYRNAVVEETLLPKGLYLLDHARVENDLDYGRVPVVTPVQKVRKSIEITGLEFMEAHTNLQCLAWPMEAFFSPKTVKPDIASRLNKVVNNLGRTLVDLRVDTLYSGQGELQTEERLWVYQGTYLRTISGACRRIWLMIRSETAARASRRRFIADFASSMTKLESIKIEGGMPRDERRETLRALRLCPLQKIVMIGVCSPLGNTWGASGADLDDFISADETENLEAEDKSAVFHFGSQEPTPARRDLPFQAEFGWPASPPMLHTIASLYASTVRELKFCGYKGSPILFSPTPITTPIFSALKHFHKLDALIVSLWLFTRFEGQAMDDEIIQYWVDARSPESTALVVAGNEENTEGWAKELKTKYAPDALAEQVTRLLGPFLSDSAKSGKCGVNVRVSFCLGDWGGIFDLETWIGSDAEGRDVCLGFEGPSEELAPKRRAQKLESRRWF